MTIYSYFLSFHDAGMTPVVDIRPHEILTYTVKTMTAESNYLISRP